jgi:hypothetical protein
MQYDSLEVKNKQKIPHYRNSSKIKYSKNVDIGKIDTVKKQQHDRSLLAQALQFVCLKYV